MAVEDKRNEARKKLQNVQRKMNRLRRERGAELSGTKHDIRVDPAKLNKYNSRQLDAFIQRANSFLDRGVQFVGLRGGTPAPLGKARQLETLEKMYNARGNSVMDKIGTLQAPFSTKTIADRDADMRPNVKAGGEPVARTFERVGTRFQNIESVDALDRFIEHRKKQLSDEYAPGRVAKGREQLDKMLTRMGADDSRAAANALTDEQFFVFWEYGPYAGDVALQYDIVKRSHEEHRPLNRDEAKDIDDIDSELKETLDWASNLPSDLNLGLAQAQQRSKSQRAARTRRNRR